VRRLSIALVHHPVLDGVGTIVTSAVTNLDIHDLARSAKTFGCESYFIVHPIAAQRELVERVCHHWAEGSSGKRIPARKEALALVRAIPSLEDVYASFGGRSEVEVWSTAARGAAGTWPVHEGRRRLEGEGKPVLLLFGTSWGMPESLLAGADGRLEPVVAQADTGYNHLSVRSACAILLDRLLGSR